MEDKAVSGGRRVQGLAQPAGAGQRGDGVRGDGRCRHDLARERHLRDQRGIARDAGGRHGEAPEHQRPADHAHEHEQRVVGDGRPE